MKTMKIEMPVVGSCKIKDCAYNSNNLCHAHAITIGDGKNPYCDTFFNSGKHTQSLENAGVGACKVAICKHNEDFECRADSIEISDKNGRCAAICITFCQRR